MDRKSPKSINQLVTMVNDVFYDHDEALGNCFYSLQQAMIGTLEVKGENTYPLKHMGKEKMKREGTLAVRLDCPYKLHEESKTYLEKNLWVLTQAEDEKKEKEAKALLEKAAKKKAKKEAKEAAAIKIGLVIVVAEKAAEARKKERDNAKNAAYVAAKADAAKKRAVTIRLEKIRLKKVAAKKTTVTATKKTDPRILRAAAANVVTNAAAKCC